MDKVMARMNAVKHRETRKRPRLREYATVSEMLGADNISYVEEGDIIRAPDSWRLTVEDANLLLASGPQSHL